MSRNDVQIGTGDTQQSTVRGKIDKLHALLTEALSIEARIVGGGPVAASEDKPSTDWDLDIVELNLDTALRRTEDVVSQLAQIERRLGS